MAVMRSVLWRITLLTGLWWVLAGHSPIGWAIGAVGILSAAWASMALRRSGMPFRFLAWVRFVPFFLWNSLRGGFDVALRVLHFRIPLQPSMLIYPTQLPNGAARVLFVNAISLLPGTLCVRLQGDSVTVHALDDAGKATKEIQALERRLAPLF